MTEDITGYEVIGEDGLIMIYRVVLIKYQLSQSKREALTGPFTTEFTLRLPS